MIGHLRGQLLSARPEVVLVDVGGVGYEVHVSLTTYSELQAKAGGRGGGGAEGGEAEVSLFVYTHVWSDGLALYGFATQREKALFERLIAVSGIGPRLARVILSGMAPADLVGALAAGDVRRLTTIPGVGKKSAERMVVELKDKMPELAAQLQAAGEAVDTSTSAATGQDQSIVSALVNLGYKETHAEKAVAEARREHPEGGFQVLLKASLGRLARG